jgi:2-iminobutanoate/2-iminopropanoate deaminase
MSNKKLIAAADGTTLRGGNCHGVRAGDFIFLSAVRGTIPNSRDVPADTKEQARQLFANIQETLVAAGATMADVVKMGVYMTDLEGDRPVFNSVWKEYFGTEPPARFAVEVANLGNPGDGSKFLADIVAYAPARG